jgi:hypothetical protein
MDRPGNKEIQLQLFWDYQFNLDLYPGFQEYFRTRQPPMLILGPDHLGPERRDLRPGRSRGVPARPDAELHLLDAGHFALEIHGDEISERMRSFMRRG